MSSWSAKCLAVRCVTQDNQGKKTPGVDGLATLEPEERLVLVSTLSLTARLSPTSSARSDRDRGGAVALFLQAVAPPYSLLTDSNWSRYSTASV